MAAEGEGTAQRLDGTVALVTGASSGIGAATARELAPGRRGRAGRPAPGLDDLAAEIEHDGGRACALETDVTDRAQAQAAVAAVVDELGRLDTVVNNAGVMLLGPIEDAPVEEWERMISLNLNGLLYGRSGVERRRPSRLGRLARRQDDQGLELEAQLPDQRMVAEQRR